MSEEVRRHWHQDWRESEVDENAGYYAGSIEEDPLYNQGGAGLEIYERDLVFKRDDLHDLHILDLGAGPEVRLKRELRNAQIRARVVSLSPDFAERKYASQARRKDPEGAMVAGVGQLLPFRDKSFDRVFICRLAGHLSEGILPGFIQEVVRVLKSGGEARYGPLANLPDASWHAYTGILEDKSMCAYFETSGVHMERQFTGDRYRYKDQWANRFELDIYALCFKKRK